MTRSLRLSFENAFYHITARGIRKENIFYSNKDKEVFLDKMNETFEKYSFICYTYCLMDNHYHLFMQTPLANISEGMHYLNTSYANWFRAKYKLIGPIFQGRYKSILVDEDSYALVLSAYIHLNPMRAGMTEGLENYPYSSFLDYIVKRKSVIKRLNTSLILRKFSGNEEQAQERYLQFIVENKAMRSPLLDTKGTALGDERFMRKITEKIKSSGKNREIKETRLISAYSSDEIIKAVSDCFHIEKDKIFEKQRGNIYRQLVLYFLKKHSALSLNQIGKLFDMDYAAVSKAVGRFEKKIEEDRTVSEMGETIAKTLEEKRNVQC